MIKVGQLYRTASGDFVAVVALSKPTGKKAKIVHSYKGRRYVVDTNSLKKLELVEDFKTKLMVLNSKEWLNAVTHSKF